MARDVYRDQDEHHLADVLSLSDHSIGFRSPRLFDRVANNLGWIQNDQTPAQISPYISVPLHHHTRHSVSAHRQDTWTPSSHLVVSFSVALNLFLPDWCWQRHTMKFYKSVPRILLILIRDDRSVWM